MSEFPVTKKAMRPYSVDRTCFHCHQPIGAMHKAECTQIRKMGTIRVTLEYPIETANCSVKEWEECYRNVGSYCQDNIISELERLKKDKGCLCSVNEIKIIHEYIGDTSGPFLSE